MKKGFTLIEVLGVVTLIGLISLIIVPLVERTVKEGKEKAYQVQMDGIYLALKNWATDNTDFFVGSNATEGASLTIWQLKSAGYLDYNLINPKTGNCIANDMIISVIRNGDKYDYLIDEESGTETEVCGSPLNEPVLILNGNFVEYVELNAPYIDKGAIAKDVDGEDISSSINIEVVDNNQIDSSLVGTYIVIYSITSGNSTVTLNRNVTVRDTTPPVLIKPGAVQLTLADTTYDYMNGVSAIDNDREPVSITTTNNIKFGISGNYYITYNATDQKGNKTVERRLVVIE